MNGSPKVDCFAVNGKATFHQRKNDVSLTVDGALALESLTVDGVFADEWRAKGGLLCRRWQMDLSSTEE